ncbi:MAG: hypothetical protein KatS3mg027_1465 [Bacteroidia bacterium]|nr:MAG: hypothetical protein KatS3mg027_1465 [Bacteroidia bacterium]
MISTKVHKCFLGMCFIFKIIFLQCTSHRYNSDLPKSKTSISIAKEDELNAQFYFYKNSDTTATFYTLFNTEPLLFARLDTGLQFYASVKITINLYSITKNKWTDSVNRIIHINQNTPQFFYSFSFPLNQDNYQVKIFITDLNRKMQYSYFTELLVTTEYSRNNFLTTIQDKMLFKPYVYEQNEVKIYHRKKLPFLYVDVFRYNHRPAPPPFSNIVPSLQYLPDSSFTIQLQQEGYYSLTVQSNCFYHIRANQNTLDGFTLFSIDSVFPNIKDSREMLYTSRYIMNKNEFERCANLSNLDEIKKCVDNFWIQIGGSKERAKEMIKNYYQRVIDANRLFTSYHYGWQSDRGMIYIVFGKPEDIQKNFQTEKWYYSLNGQKNALVFTFHKNKNNPFTNSDYILERSDYYKDIWYLTVDKIRQGRLSVK